jgi:hypothetical protein
LLEAFSLSFPAAISNFHVLRLRYLAVLNWLSYRMRDKDLVHSSIYG